MRAAANVIWHARGSKSVSAARGIIVRHLTAGAPKSSQTSPPRHRHLRGADVLPRAARLRVGQRVRIALGPFTGFYGIYRGGRRNHDLVELRLGQVRARTHKSRLFG